jgi:hypothetical protein
MKTIISLRTVVTVALIIGAAGVLRAAPTPVGTQKEKSETHAIMPTSTTDKKMSGTSTVAPIPANITKVFSEAAHGGIVGTVELVKSSGENYYKGYVTPKDGKLKGHEIYVSLGGVMLDHAPASQTIKTLKKS